MAKRFTDSKKFDKEWFRKLPLKMKVAWDYLTCACDHAGIWEIDLELMSFQTGAKFTLKELTDTFDVVIIEDKLFVTGFFDFQYGESKDGFKAKQSALRVLSRYGFVNSDGTLTRQLPKTTGTVPVQSPDCHSISISISKKEEECEEKPKRFDFEPLYAAYPRKRGKDAGMKRLRARIKTEADYRDFARAVRKYASDVRVKRTDEKYVMMWSTFVGTEKGEPWHDFIEPPATHALPGPVDTPRIDGVFESGASQPATPVSNLPEDMKQRLAILSGKRAGA